MHDTSSIAVVGAKVELAQCGVIKLLVTQPNILLKGVVLYAHRARKVTKYTLICQIQFFRIVVIEDPGELWIMDALVM